MENNKILEVRNLQKYFPVKGSSLGNKGRIVRAVEDISFDLYEGETLGLVGESGCGKSTLGRAIIRLHEPTSGTVKYNGEDILAKNRKEMRKLRQDVQIIFQDPYSSLNPRMSVFNILSEPLIAHGKFKKGSPELKEYVLDLMKRCGLPEYYCYRFPHQFSGGQRQRIGIARSLALQPKFVVCDEPVSALDVSIQSQILNLMMDIQEEQGISYLFISHDLSVVRHISDRIGVMYLGSLVEIADAETLFENPLHPYTRALLGAIPVPDPTSRKEMTVIEGEIPSNVDIPSGCKFRTRCPFATEKCAAEAPVDKDFGEGHKVLCHYAGEL